MDVSEACEGNRHEGQGEAREPRGSKAEAMASWDLGFGFYSERSKMTFHSFCNSLRNQAALSQFH